MLKHFTSTKMSFQLSMPTGDRLKSITNNEKAGRKVFLCQFPFFPKIERKSLEQIASTMKMAYRFEKKISDWQIEEDKN